MKTFKVILLLAGVLFALAGCSNDDVDKQIQIEKERQKKVDHMKTKMNAQISNTPIKLP